jgi:hypothetical protein
MSNQITDHILNKKESTSSTSNEESIVKDVKNNDSKKKIKFKKGNTSQVKLLIIFFDISFVII